MRFLALASNWPFDIPQVSRSTLRNHPERYFICENCGTPMPDVNYRKIRIKNGGWKEVPHWACPHCRYVIADVNPPLRPDEIHPAIQDPWKEDRDFLALGIMQIHYNCKIEIFGDDWVVYRAPQVQDVGTESTTEPSFGNQSGNDEKEDPGFL